MEEHYVTLLRKALDRELGVGSKLEYSIIVDNSSTSSRNPHAYTINVPTRNAGYNNKNEVGIPLNVNANIHNPFIIPGLKKINIDSQLNPNYTFDNFIEGDCNRLARSAGFAVANKPGGTAFNH